LRSLFRSVLSILWVIAVPTPSVLSKTPGEVHCYQLTCHRVLTVEETKSLVSSTRILVASYYDDPRVDPFNTGELTSSGEKFDADNSGRVASAIYPDGTELLLWNPLNGRTAHVRVNDFGPFHTNRTLDLTRALAKRLDVTHQGVTVLLATVVAPPRPEEPLYRSFRTYPKAKGYLGIYEEDALPAIAKKLTAESEGLSATEPANSRIISNIPLPVRKPSPRFGPRDTIRTANHPSETIFDEPPRTLQSLPPLDIGVLLTPPLAGKANVQPDVVVAFIANTPSRAAEVSIKRLKFSGVWSDALPRRSTPNLLFYLIAVSMGMIVLQRLARASIVSTSARGGRVPNDQPHRAGATRTLARERISVVKQCAQSSVIGPDLQINGCLVSTNDVLIEGSVDGDCVCRQLVIKSNGRLTGDAVAEVVIVSGSVKGRILAKTVGLTSRAVVVGDVNYCDLIVERRATLEATVQRISRDCWDEGAVEQRSMISATPQTSA
jgi:rare lipoprotein A (peptidoglycan hydrolase)/cytoskeletal protein CcmA (bactofilin family)